MRVTTRLSVGGSCWACGKLTKKQIAVNLGYDGVTFGICPMCARKLVKGLVRALNAKEKARSGGNHSDRQERLTNTV